MNARDFVQNIQSAGFTLAVHGGNLAVTPASRLSELQRQFIKAHKPAILAALTGTTAPETSPANDPTGQQKPAVPHQGKPAPADHPKPGNSPTGATGGYEATDDRRRCSGCLNLSGGRCLAASRGDIIAARIYRPDPDRPRRCSGYHPSATDPDRRPGWERWPGLPDRPALEIKRHGIR
jgi:hypothetical protein